MVTWSRKHVGYRQFHKLFGSQPPSHPHRPPTSLLIAQPPGAGGDNDRPCEGRQRNGTRRLAAEIKMGDAGRESNPTRAAVTGGVRGEGGEGGRMNEGGVVNHFPACLV